MQTSKVVVVAVLNSSSSIEAPFLPTSRTSATIASNTTHLPQELEADTVQKTGRLKLPEAENIVCLSGMSPDENGISSRVSLHEMWRIPALISLSVDYEKRARRHMSTLRTGAKRGCRFEYSQLRQFRRREAQGDSLHEMWSTPALISLSAD